MSPIEGWALSIHEQHLYLCSQLPAGKEHHLPEPHHWRSVEKLSFIGKGITATIVFNPSIKSSFHILKPNPFKSIFLCFLCLLYLPVTGSGSSSPSTRCFPVNQSDNWSSWQSLLVQQTLLPSHISSEFHSCSWIFEGRSRLVVSLAQNALPAWFWSCSFLSDPQMTYEKNKAFPGWADGFQRDTFSGRAGCVNDFSKVPLSHCQQCHFQKVNPVEREQGKMILTTQHYVQPMWRSCKHFLAHTNSDPDEFSVGSGWLESYSRELKCDDLYFLEKSSQLRLKSLMESLHWRPRGFRKGFWFHPNLLLITGSYKVWYYTD